MKVLKLLFFLGMMAFTCKVSSQNVYITKTGEKYHKSTCHYLKNSKKEITFNTAKERGFTACSVCKPKVGTSSFKAVESSQQIIISPSSTSKTHATQCTDKTNSGKRCKRLTKSANGRCYQHE